MKTKIKDGKEFQPVTIELTFETQFELDAIGTLFNVNPIIEAVKRMKGKVPDTDVFENAGADIHQCDEFISALEDTDYFKTVMK